VVIPRIDHRETSYSPAAFEAAYRFITGKAPALTTITSEAAVVLNGKITGMGVMSDDPKTGNFHNNLPIPGARLQVYAVNAATGARQGTALLDKAADAASGQWGPLRTAAGTPLEFVVSAPGYATTHIYRSGFPRSSELIHLRAERIAEADKASAAIVTFARPRGYFRREFDFGRCAINGENSIWSARMRRLRRMKSSHRLGT
jgi:triacylglycerol lipase